MTAKEIFNKYKVHTSLSEGDYDYLVDEEDFEKAAIEYAKYHVKEALKKASEKATMKVEYPDECYSESNEYGQTYFNAHDIECGGEYGGITIEEESILYSYPLNLIN